MGSHQDIEKAGTWCLLFLYLNDVEAVVAWVVVAVPANVSDAWQDTSFYDAYNVYNV